MKRLLLLLFLLSLTVQAISQKTLMVEKTGTHRRYFFHAGDYIKLRVSKQDTLLTGKIWALTDSSV